MPRLPSLVFQGRVQEWLGKGAKIYKSMKHLGLFEGIGGFSLAARWMGWKTVAWCEWDPFCQTVLKHHFPEAEQHGDITTTDFTRYAGQIDVLTGGFPCQPYSSAGKRLGKEDDRHLWPEMLRAIREIQPRWVLGENVRGLTNWNGGLVFDEVQADLENEGYEVTPYLLPACAVNAPHRRDRIWFVAHAKEDSRHNGTRNDGYYPQSVSCKGFNESIFVANANESPTGPPGTSASIEGNGCENDSKPELWGEQAEQHIRCDELLRNAANTNSDKRQKGRVYQNGRISPKRYAGPRGSWGIGRAWKDFPTKSPVCSRNDGLSSRLDGITFPKWREKSIGAYGNAIVPQVALQIFKAIQQYEQ